MRDAALSLALTEGWAGQLANPRQMAPYTYADSPAVVPGDDGPVHAARIGAMLPDAALDPGAGGGFLSARLGPGFTLISLGTAVEGAHPDLTVVTLAPGSRAAQRLGLEGSGALLVRPDLHIGARWRDAPAPDAVSAAVEGILTGKGR